MAIALAFPYEQVHLERLSAAEFSSLDSAGAWVLGTVTDSTIPFTTPAQSISSANIAALVASVAPTRDYDPINVTSVGDSATRTRQGRLDWECAMTLYLDDGTDDILANPSGHFVLYVKRPDDSGYVAVVDITNITENVEDGGRLTFDLTLRNASRRPPQHFSG